MYLLGYGGNSLSFAISTNVGSAAYLTSTDALNDGRSGLITSFSFSSGTAATTQYTSLDVTLAAHPLDATPPWGIVSIQNVQGLPLGTLLKFNGVSQRLVAGPRGELRATWLFSGLTGAGPNGIRIYNDVNGSHSITPGATCGAGEIFVGRCMGFNTLAASQPASDRIDTTQTTVMAAGQNYQFMRLPRRSIPAGKLGIFSTSDAQGGSTSSLVSGANPAGKIDIETLIDILSTTRLAMVCPVANKGGAGTVVNGVRYDQDFMQPNWILARPLAIGGLMMDQDPFWTWAPQWQEAT
jgi:hypothetical protein